MGQQNKFHASQLAALWCRGTWSAKAVLQDLQEAVDLGYDMFNSWSGHVNKRVTSRSEETVQDPDYSARRRANRMDKAISQPIDDGVKAANRRSSLPIRVASSSDTSPPGPSPVAVLYEWHAAITNVERATDEQFAVNFSALHNDLQTFMHDREADDEHRGDRTRDWVFYQPEREFISGSQSPLKMGIRL